MAELNSELSVSTETDFISSGKGRQHEGELSQQQKDDIIRQMLPPRLPTPRTQRTIEFNPSMAPVAVLENFEQAVQKLPTPKGIINDLAEIKATVGTENLPNILAPVVKIYCNHVYPNYSMPWQMRRQQKSTSSGFAIAGRQLLTNAHGIDFHTSVRVRKYGSATKFQAKVLHIGQECDLAILTVADDAFWKDLPIFEFGDIPQLQDSVTVVGYPTGGDNISVTRGVVSRIDVQEYSHASCRLLAVQIDAAINPGNSGGPAVKDNKVIGVAFEALEEAENIGYIIPTPVITHFLRDIERHRRYTGFPGSGFRWQQLESQHLKRYLHVSEQQTGILVNDVFPLAPAAQHLQRDDVILSIDSVDIADDGTIAFRGGERVNFMHAITSKFVGDSCDFEVLRNGQASHVTIRLAAPTPLVPIHCDSKAPSYLIYGGMVFVPLNRPYLINEYTKNWDKRAPIGLCELAFGGQLSDPEDQAVILSQVLAGEVNVGYHNVANIQLLSFNGQRVRNLRHLKELLDANREEYVRFDLYQNKAVVLKVDEVERAKEDLNKEHNISASMSHDLTQSATPKIRQDVGATKPKETTPSSASSIDKKKLMGESDMAAPMVK